jgi:glucose-6-phosphate isomerase
MIRVKRQKTAVTPRGLLTARPAWKTLQKHYESIRHLHLRQLFDDNPRRGERLTAGLYLIFSKVGALKKKFLLMAST